jgi:hypothetical protein
MQRVTFEDFRPLFGLRIDAAEVAAFLEGLPDHRITRPSDGYQYVVCRRLGFDLLFRSPTGYQGGRTEHLRVLECAFLFRRGEDRHKEYADLPFGLAFTDSHADLVGKLGEPFLTSFDRGQESLTWANWRIDGFTVQAKYDPEAGTVRQFAVFTEATDNAVGRHVTNPT